MTNRSYALCTMKNSRRLNLLMMKIIRAPKTMRQHNTPQTMPSVSRLDFGSTSSEAKPSKKREPDTIRKLNIHLLQPLRQSHYQVHKTMVQHRQLNFRNEIEASQYLSKSCTAFWIHLYQGNRYV